MKTQMCIVVLLFMVWSNMLVAQSWNALNSGYDSSLYDVYFVDKNLGFAGGDHGVILKTENGGIDWKKVYTGINEGLACIRFVDTKTGFASSGFYNKYANVLKTTDGGSNWKKTNVPEGKTGGGMWFINAQKGFYAYADTLYKASVISRTLNGGETWDTVYRAKGWISYFFFTDELNGYATVNNGSVLKTIDGGSNWSEINLANILWASGIAFLNKDTGFVGGQPMQNPDNVTIYKTTDGGGHWSPIVTSNMILKIAFPDKSRVFALSVDNLGKGYLIRSEDVGESWNPEATPGNPLRGMFFFNKELGYAVGEGGTIIKFDVNNSVKNKLNSVDGFALYPNPLTFGNKLEIFYPENYSFFEIEVYNVLGKQVYTRKLQLQFADMDVSSLTNGIYFVVLKADRKNFTQRLILKR